METAIMLIFIVLGIVIILPRSMRKDLEKTEKKLEKARHNNAGTYQVSPQAQNSKPVMGVPAPPVGTPISAMSRNGQSMAPQNGKMVGGILIEEDEQVVATIGVEPFTDAKGKEVVRNGVGILTDRNFYYKGVHYTGIYTGGASGGKAKNIESGRVAIEDILSVQTVTKQDRRNKDQLLYWILCLPCLLTYALLFGCIIIGLMQGRETDFISTLLTGLAFWGVLSLAVLLYRTLTGKMAPLGNLKFTIIFRGYSFSYNARLYSAQELQEFQNQLHLLQAKQGYMYSDLIIGQDEKIISTLGLATFTGVEGSQLNLNGRGILTDKYFYYAGNDLRKQAKERLVSDSFLEWGRIPTSDIVSVIRKRTSTCSGNIKVSFLLNFLTPVLLAIEDYFFHRQSAFSIFSEFMVLLIIINIFIFLIHYLKSRKRFFIISFQSGDFSYDTSLYSSAELREFQNSFNLLQQQKAQK